MRRKQPSELIATGIAGIDLNNTIVTGQKIPFFADPDQPFNQVMADVALRAKADVIILGGMGNLPGVILAAILLTVLPEVLRPVAEYRAMLDALLLIVLMLVRPQGLFTFRRGRTGT